MQTHPVQLQDVHFSHGTRRVLNGVDLTVAKGRILGLLGGNGAGKTTTLNLLLGALQASSGDVRVFGLDPWRQRDAVLQQLAYVPENVSLYDHLTALENIEYLMGLTGTPASTATVADVLAAVALPKEAWSRPLRGYSKGMRQKVAIALALARGVPLLLMDEPTSGLDPQAAFECHALLRRLRDGGASILMVTHDVFALAEIADDIAFLAQGRAQAVLPNVDGEFDPVSLHQQYSGRCAG